MFNVNVSFETTYKKGINIHDGEDTVESVLNEQFVKYLYTNIHLIGLAAKDVAKKLNDDSVNAYFNILDNFEKSVEKTIKYEVINEDDLIQHVKVSFSFDYESYAECDQTKLDYFIDFLMSESIYKPLAVAKDVKERFYHMPGVDKVAADKYIAKLNHVGEMMTQAKKTLVYDAMTKKEDKKLKN